MGGGSVWSSANRYPNPAHRLSNGENNEIESERSSGSMVDSVFWAVPTRIEVENAILALRSFMQRVSSSGSALDTRQTLSSNHDPRILQSPGFQRILDAFRLLQTVPAVQRMVASISSDRAVWNAVLNNNEVREFRRSLNQATPCTPRGSNEEPDLLSMVFRWILDNMKLKVVELVEALKSLVSKNFASPRRERTSPGLKPEFEEMICSTVLLSTITLMIVLVTRAYGS